LIKGILICTTILLLALYAFIRSPYLTDSVEWLLNRYAGIEIEIGSINLSRRTTIRDVMVRMPDGPLPLLKIRMVRIRMNPLRLLNGEIDGIELTEPEITLDLTSSGGGNKGMGRSIRVNTLRIDGGRMMVRTREAEYIHIRSINLVMKEKTPGKVMAKGSLYIEELRTDIPVDMTFDLGKMEIEDGHLHMVYDELGAVTGGRVTGGLDMDITISTEDGLTAIIDALYKDIVYIGRRALSAGGGRMRLLLRFSSDLEDVRFQVNGSGSYTLYGREDNYSLDLKGSYGVKKGRMVIDEASLNSTLYGNLTLRGRIEDIPSGRVSLDLTLKTRGPELGRLGEVFKVQGETDARIRSVFLIKGEGDRPDIKGRVQIKGRYFKGEGIDIRGIRAMIPVEYRDGSIRIKGASMVMDEAEYLSGDRGYLLKGSLEISPQLSMDIPDGLIKAHIRLALRDGGLSTPDESLVAEGLRIEADMDAESSYPADEVGFTISGMATGLELLVGSFYGDFTHKDIKFSSTGRYSMDRDLLDIRQAGIDLQDIGTFTFSGNISRITSSPAIDAELIIKGLRNDNVYDLFIKDTFRESIPLPGRLNTDGRTSIRLSLKSSGGLTQVDGMIYLDDVDIRGDGFSIEGIDLAMPVEISYPLTEQTGVPSYGSLRIGAISMGGVEIDGLSLSPTIWHNELIFRDDILVPVLGGEVVLRGVRFGGIMDDEPVLSFSSEIRGVDLQMLTRALDIQRFGGNISGSIPKARLSRNSLTVDGEVVIRAFGGEIRITELSVNNLFSNIPSIRTSIQLNDIDLGMLTDTFEFGKITGVMNGYVRDLVITNGEVERFDISLESIKKRGVSQWISVKALKKISILGSGGPASILDRGIYRLFKRYRYEKMGIRGGLRNDRMVLHGIMRQGDREYIVKGGLLPPKVDVISYTQEISFKELIRRLRRIREVE